MPPQSRPARACEMVAIDFECTGVVDELPSEPWQIGMVRFVDGQVDGTRYFESLIRVGARPFNPHAPGKHHLLREQIAAAPGLQALWPTCKNWWYGAPLIAHNAGTERNVLARAAPMHAPGPWVDTLRLARRAFPGLASYRLDDLLQVLDLKAQVASCCPDREPHDALYDAIACAVLLGHILQRDGWRDMSVEALTLV